MSKYIDSYTGAPYGLEALRIIKIIKNNYLELLSLRIIWQTLHTEKSFWSLAEIRLYLPSTDRFGTVNGQCPFGVPNQSVHGEYNLISV